MSTEATDTFVAAPGVIDESHLLRSVIRLAWPVVVQQVSFSMVQLVDTALVGHLGEDALAGVRLAGQIFGFSRAGLVAVAIGATAIIARSVGAGEPQLASKTLRNAIAMAALWGLAMGLVMWFFGGWGLGMLGAEAGAQHQGTVYLKAAAVGMPLWSLVYAGSASLQGAGDTRTPLNIGVPAGVEQAQFNVAFMLYTRIIASLGTTALAAHGVTLAIQSLTFGVGFALSIATTALVGQSLGAQRPDLAERSTYLAMRYSLVFMCVLGVLMMIFGGDITGLFVGGDKADDVVDIGRKL